MGIDEHLETVRQRLDRVAPEHLATEIDGGAIVVDIRPEADRQRFGSMPGALVMERNVLEWRLCPGSDSRLDVVTETSRVIVFCNDGYASSLAAHSLQIIGLPAATDLDGGYNRWRAFQDGA